VPFEINVLSNKGTLHYDSKDAATSQSVNAASFASDCATCHADATSGGSPTPGAPACQVCHTKASPVTTGTDRGTCLSCHSTTRTTMLAQGPRGTVFPDLPGHHSKHFGAGSDVGLTSCSDCHNGTEWGTQPHYDAANNQNPQTVAIVRFSTYVTNQSPSASYNPATRTCALTCHGPQGDTHTHSSGDRW
jgi:hypothetical protein